MCRSTETGSDFVPYTKDRDRDRDRDRLKIRTFHLRFSISSSSVKLPETLTLVYLPRINGNPLEINGAKIRADLPSFVALHRARSMDDTPDGSEAVYASADRVRAGEAVRFEVYVGSQKAVKGVFRRSGRMWGLECKSEMDLGRVGVLGAEILVGGERGVLMREKLKVEPERRRRRRFCLKLEEIVEEGEREGCDCCCDDDEDDDDDDSDKEREEWEMSEEEEEEEMDGGKWVEMGIWMMCVGVGYLGYKGLRRRRFI